MPLDGAQVHTNLWGTVSKSGGPQREYATFQRSLLTSGTIRPGSNIQLEGRSYSLRQSGDPRLLGKLETGQDAERCVYEQVKCVMPYEQAIPAADRAIFKMSKCGNMEQIVFGKYVLKHNQITAALARG